MSEISPTARALRALDVLQARPGVTAAELAQRLGVTERAARRYVAILREADIPVESTRGPYGGYTLGRGLRLPPLVFSATEALGLVMAALDSQHAVADPDDPVGSALGKILRVLPTNVARQAVTLRETARSVPERGVGQAGPRRDEPSWSPPWRRSDRCASATARRPATPAPSRSTRGRWWCATAGGTCCATPTTPTRCAPSASTGSPRSPRSRGPSRCRPTSTRPPSSRPTSARAGSTRRTSCSTRPFDEVRPWIRPTLGDLRELPDGRCELVGSTSNPQAYAGEWLAGIPFDVHRRGRRGAAGRGRRGGRERLARSVSD